MQARAADGSGMAGTVSSEPPGDVETVEARPVRSNSRSGEIDQFVARYNENGKPSVCTASAASIPEKLH
ncbi:hypothetical protein [Burkholderia plantarii]|uniref:hypothetical protein n=2 Tax=Burkholderia plantarii TaxID=41899 RepID=UPI000A8B301A|nr:hypothetical protein [Burkholderia plantarii]GLZ20358.1 hypothetical protein Bpla01_38870 [Burkholderia plantarii]